MKTYNYGVELMTPMQADKEILFNEAQLKFDSFCASSVIGFVDQIPIEWAVGEKYILSAGEYAGSIIYCPDLSKGWQILTVKPSMLIFVYKENSFFIFDYDKKWSKVIFPTGGAEVNNTEQTKFISIEDQFTIAGTGEHIALYLNGDCKITIAKAKSAPLTVIIKQAYNNSFKIEWVSTVLWSQKIAHKMTATLNAIDIVQFYPMPETDHFLGTILGQNYQY